TEREPSAEVTQIRLMRAHRVGAILVAGSGYVEPAMEADAARELEAFQESGGRVAVIGRHHLHSDAVLPDNEAAAASITAHVLALGHRRLAVAAGPERLTTVADRTAGVRSAVAAHGRDPGDLLVVHPPLTRGGGRDASARILAARPAATASLALIDGLATGSDPKIERDG